MAEVVKLEALDGGHSISSLVEKFLEDLEVLGRSPTTVANYRSDLRQLERFTEGAPVRQITGEALLKFMLTQKGKAPATRARRQAAINSFLTWCVRFDHLDANPAAKLVPVQRVEAVPRPMKAREVEKVLAAVPAQNLRDKLLFTLVAETGMRIGEALGICVEDIDLTPDSELIRIRKPKGHRERSIVLDDAPRTRRLLRRFLSQAGRSGPLFRGNPSKRNRAKAEGPLTYRAARHAWKKYCARAKVEGTIHQLRHTVGTALVNDGLPHEAVRRRLGHRTLAMVNRYGEMSDEKLRQHLRQRERTRRKR